MHAFLHSGGVACAVNTCDALEHLQEALVLVSGLEWPWRGHLVKAMEAVRHGSVRSEESSRAVLLAEAALGCSGPTPLREHEVALQPTHAGGEQLETLITTPSGETMRIRSELRAVRSLLHHEQPSKWRIRQEGVRYNSTKASNLRSAVFTRPPEATVHSGSDVVNFSSDLGHSPVFEFVRSGHYLHFSSSHTRRSTKIRICNFLPVQRRLDPRAVGEPLVRASFLFALSLCPTILVSIYFYFRIT
jgi:hypothetical protein